MAVHTAVDTAVAAGSIAVEPVGRHMAPKDPAPLVEMHSIDYIDEIADVHYRPRVDRNFDYRPVMSPVSVVAVQDGSTMISAVSLSCLRRTIDWCCCRIAPPSQQVMAVLLVEAYS